MVSREGFDRGIWDLGEWFWLEFRSSIERFLLSPFFPCLSPSVLDHSVRGTSCLRTSRISSSSPVMPLNASPLIHSVLLPLTISPCGIYCDGDVSINMEIEKEGEGESGREDGGDRIGENRGLFQGSETSSICVLIVLFRTVSPS